MTIALPKELFDECLKQDAENAGHFAATSATLTPKELIAIHANMRDRPGFLDGFKSGMAGGEA